MLAAHEVPATPNFSKILPKLFFTRSSGSVSWTSWCHMTGLQPRTGHRSRATRRERLVIAAETACLEFLDLWSKRPEPVCCQGSNVTTALIRQEVKWTENESNVKCNWLHFHTKEDCRFCPLLGFWINYLGTLTLFGWNEDFTLSCLL